MATVTTVFVAYAATGCSAGTDLAGQHSDGRASGVDSPGRGGPLTPFDVDRPAIARLDAGLLRAVQAAARDAEDDGIAFVVTSGWRSRAHQERLFAEAVTTYGSVQEASRFVAAPDASAHVTGHAVDIGPTDADSWLSQHGARYGLCQTFANEMWHFELAATPGGVCPVMLPDGSSR
ncbi:M15 family metallopeptidase [Nocardioides sp. LHG3406-4]|uniref:M15 family metallopeptidase n=1 Tax=Nocardioides sp. LHG3406-4 TaxID=2804575 RepID=UPI003CF44AEE